MEKEFIPYEIALKLKELGFDEHCFGYFYTEDKFFETKIKNSELEEECSISAPTFSQALRWFREKHGLICIISMNEFHDRYKGLIKGCSHQLIIPIYLNATITYEEAELECLKKLIEIVINKN